MFNESAFFSIPLHSFLRRKFNNNFLGLSTSRSILVLSDEVKKDMNYYSFSCCIQGLKVIEKRKQNAESD